MKLITAIIRPDDLPGVMSAATDAGARGLTATRASGFGRQYGHVRKAARTGSQPVLLPKARVEIVVSDEEADTVVNAVLKCMSTGSVGDGKVWVVPVDTVVRASTGARDLDAI